MKVELLSPAGSLKKLKYAYKYGADAAYVGVKDYSLRAAGLEYDELKKSIQYAKENKKYIYIALNIFANNSDLKGLKETIKRIDELKPDSFIVSDPGVFTIIKENSSVNIHISTQANINNYESAYFWQNLGAKRVTLARELSIDEILEINKRVEIETEVFIHGAMCLSYSGRCLLSNYFKQRDANRGDCAQPCRWNYYLIEEKNNKEYLPITEDDRGSYILSSKDMCLLEYLPDLIKTGVNSFKIEGRMKSIHYVSAVTKAYKQEIENYYQDPNKYEAKKENINELNKISHRPYSSGFIKGEGEQVKGHQSYMKDSEFVAEVIEEKKEVSKIAVKNRLENGELLDVLVPERDNFNWKIENMTDIITKEVLSVAHANYVVTVKGRLPKYSLLRRNNDK